MKDVHRVILTAGFALTLVTASAFAGARNGRVLTLEEAVTLALEHNARLNAARAGVEGARQRVRVARANLLPKVDAQLGYRRLDPASVRRANVFLDVGRELVRQFGTGDPNDVRPGAYLNTFATTLQVVQPIYNGGANWAAAAATQAQEEGEAFNLEDTEQEVILQVRTRYLRALQARELLALAQKTLEASRAHLKAVRKMFEVGMRSRTEVLRWEVQAAGDEGRLVEAENQLAIALAALKQVLGVPQSEAFSLVPLHLEPDTVMADLDRLIEQARLEHPRLKALAATVDAQRAGVRLARASLLPKVNFVYQLGWEQNNTLALDSFAYWNAAVAVQIPLFHSFGNVAKVQESRAELNRLQALQTESERLVAFEVIRARLRLQAAYKRIQIARKAVEQAEANLRSLSNTFEVGLAANIDVLDGEVILRKARTDLIQARYDFWIARAELDRAIGTISP